MSISIGGNADLNDIYRLLQQILEESRKNTLVPVGLMYDKLEACDRRWAEVLQEERLQHKAELAKLTGKVE